MKLLLVLLLSSPVWAQEMSPKIDPDKFTICAITINSDDEKKVFQAQAAKQPSKFNPVVELTSFGDESNWFKSACESKVRCDQLVISGHFGGTFFSDKDGQEKELSLREMEEAGCSKSCEGILKDPYEVFLFGCNTLSGKEADHRTPAQYLQVLLNDGIPLQQAELVVESRYGSVGDSHKSSMQRVFGGAKKQIYGFDSVGPSGANVKGFLQNYFSKISPSAQLEKQQAKRMMDSVDLGNTILATSLKTTAFTQCGEGDLNDPVTKNICALQDKRSSASSKIALISELFTKDNFLVYLPAINNFMKGNTNFTADDKAELKKISSNEVIKGQILGLLDKTSSLGLKTEWISFAANLNFLSEEDASKRISETLESALKGKLSRALTDQLCSLELPETMKVTISDSFAKTVTLNKPMIDTLGCFKFKNDLLHKKLAQKFITLTDPESRFAILQSLSLAYSERKDELKLSPQFQQSLQTELVSKQENIPAYTVNFLSSFGLFDKQLETAALKLFSKKDDYSVYVAIEAATKYKPTNESLLKETSRYLTDKKFGTQAISALTASGLQKPWIEKSLLAALTAETSDSYNRREISAYFEKVGISDPQESQRIKDWCQKPEKDFWEVRELCKRLKSKN
jgi:hypothetical protein